MSAGKPACAGALLARRGPSFLTRFVVPAVGIASSLLWCGAAWTEVISYHDVSDPVKTAGWACDTDSAASVRVHLYAQTAAGLKLLDSQWADKYRGDLQNVCGGPDHAFRFADYAATADGAALYGTRDAAPMYVYVESPTGLVPIIGSPRNVSFAAVGLWDTGLKSGRWRTDYDNPGEGAAAAPLLMGECPFATPVSDGYFAFSGGGFDPLTRCRYGNIVFPRTNAASSDGTWPMRSFWAVVANVEDAIENPLCVNGPPGQSLPVGPPGAGEVFGLAALPDLETGNPDRLKMHMVLNSRNWTACRNGSYGGPYLAFTAHAERGNNGILTYLNLPGAPTTLRFGMTLMDIAGGQPELYGAPAGAKRYSQSHVLIEAVWGGVKRWLFIELVPDGRFVSGTAKGSIDAHVRFNWHMVDSMLHPGADYLFKSGTVLTAQCQLEDVVIPVLDRAATYVNSATRALSRRDYSIDLQRVFNCLNRRREWGAAPMPAHPVPVTGVTFGMEQDDRFYLDGEFTGVAAPNALWIAVDSVRLE
jgi:hypothetical protein